MEIEEKIEQDSDPRLVGCFLNGSGTNIHASMYLHLVHGNYMKFSKLMPVHNEK